ncbi:MAG: nitroreductase family protein [Muribaculaceae bacterium]|nr:nitroreductase family protein [Muribaculaceae bacterium]
MNVIEAMKERRSVRTYDGRGLTENQRKAMLQAIAESNSPFGGHLTIRMKKFNLKDGYKPTTYGMIKGAGDFFLLGYGNDDASMLTAGYQFEQVVLKAWENGLGTCWIAATFKGTDFETGEMWPEGEELKIVSPVGVAAKKSMMEKIARFTVGSQKRKPMDELFFFEDFKHAIPEDNRFREALEMMRLAPSSTNSQPWRALVAGNKVHFYAAPKSKLCILDTGIGICHFHETEKYKGTNGEFMHVADAPGGQEGWQYVTTYVAE